MRVRGQASHVRVPSAVPRWAVPLGLALATLALILALGEVWGGQIIGALRLLQSGIDVHPDTTHSFFLDGHQSVVCARNTGLYCGAFLTVAWAWVSGRGRGDGFPPLRVGLALALMVGVMVADGLDSFVADLGYTPAYEPNNLVRLATGLLAGAAVAAYVLPAINSLLWRRPDPRPLLPGYRALAVLLACLAPLWGVVALGLGPAALPVAVLTTASALWLLATANLTFAVLLCRWDNRFEDPASLARPGTVAVAVALLELAGMAVLMHQAFPGLYHPGGLRDLAAP